MVRSALVLACALAVSVPLIHAQPFGSDRAFEPVVLSGADLSTFSALLPDAVAVFRYDETGWVRIPSQIDEREYMDLAWAYDGRDGIRCDTTSTSPTYCWDSANYGHGFATLYTNSGTFVGDDTDPFLDFDDEVVFMAKDAGNRAPSGVAPPDGVFGPSGMEVRVTVPANEISRPFPGYVYLFHHDGRYTAVDTSYVSYTYNLLSGPFSTTYIVGGQPHNGGSGYALGTNPEDSWVETPYYRRHYSDRWIEDGLEILAGSGVDILDRIKYQRRLGHCSRTETTGSTARGTMIANVSGPVRAIRSVLGFNSGPLRQRDHLYYEQYARTTNFWRVHNVNGLSDYFDHTAAATGMQYTSNLNATPFTVDGIPDGPLDAGALEWDMLQGAQGTLVTRYLFEMTFGGLEDISIYEDEAPSSVEQCTADEHMYGAHGRGLDGEIPGTDPIDGDLDTLTYHWHQLYAGPALSAASAEAFVGAIDAPLKANARLYTVAAEVPTVPPTGGFLRTGDAETPPLTLRLQSPIPNPATGTATVIYDLNVAASITAELYDILGRRVRLLDEGVREAGQHRLLIDARSLSSGVYVVRLMSPSGVQAVRFIRP